MVKSIYDSSANAVEMRNVSKIYKLKKIVRKVKMSVFLL